MTLLTNDMILLAKSLGNGVPALRDRDFPSLPAGPGLSLASAAAASSSAAVAAVAATGAPAHLHHRDGMAASLVSVSFYLGGFILAFGQM